jgi:Fuc2NAc and GlcNAc transferase
VVPFLSALLCWLYLLLARRLQLLDHPNDRSSHQRPTPHGGGLPLLLAFAVAVLVAGPWGDSYLVLLGLALLLMLAGVLDDLVNLSVRLRMSVYALCCLLMVWWLVPSVNPLLGAILALASLWLLNLYNFMDGIDGIAATQCILACTSAALLAWFGGTPGGDSYALFCLLLAGAQVGFLFWNWPPARLFMGDAGSVPTGFLLAGLAVLGAVQGSLSPAAWVILLAAFITDASWTLLWRLLTGQPVTQAHRLHAYQRLSRHWSSHLAVDVLLLAINALWLFPLAWAVQAMTEYTGILVILAYLPLLLGMVKIARFT